MVGRDVQTVFPWRTGVLSIQRQRPMQRIESTREPKLVEFDELGIHVFESRHARDFSMPRRRWDFHKLCVIEAGRGTLIAESASQALAAGEVVFLPAGSEHTIEDEPSDPLTLMMACFHDHVFEGSEVSQQVRERFCQEFPAAEPVPLTGAYRIAGVMNALRLMIFEQSRARFGSGAMISAQLLELLVFLTRAHRQAAELADEDPATRSFAASVAVLENEFYRPIQIQELAEVANLSYRAYTDRFKRELGQTVNQHLAELRVEYAKQRMVESGNILHAALQAGFGDLGHFYRVFRRVTGMTPKTYLTSVREEGDA